MKTKILLMLTLLLMLALPVFSDTAAPPAVETIKVEAAQPAPEFVADRVTALNAQPLRSGAPAQPAPGQPAPDSPRGMGEQILKAIAGLIGLLLSAAIHRASEYFRAKSDLAVVQTGVVALEESAIGAVTDVWEAKSKYYIEKWARKEITPDDYDKGMNAAGEEAWKLALRILGGAGKKLSPKLGDVEALLKAKMQAHFARLKADAERTFSIGK